MRLLLTLGLALVTAFSAYAEKPLDLNAFAQQYYKTMTATQAPNAGAKELEAYLALLTDDIGNQHIPYQPDDSRTPDGKEQMRKGMSFYLGAHTLFEAHCLIHLCLMIQALLFVIRVMQRAFTRKVSSQ